MEDFENLEGRQANETVYDSEGHILIQKGSEVSKSVIESAKIAGKIDDLRLAVETDDELDLCSTVVWDE